ncbi:Retrovirus-related Pol polyprotein from transposon TNT 1-94 [Vitis vinifera]|uniref:Retrovirus-related Pol polyprotein from transposon TNT 1-94 n=1 Tax=Vitis vinifera TaxID=29760 RepID=A0A438FZ82_VITVI|nr:Retrovirus-related Pol polyprotein from transposon TNT 1-94 [Vitis vinifera]RVX19527.1 Retrovirus-related Pol polyprotein from transposon TNT 1-94 [Vitis vinifera]
MISALVLFEANMVDSPNEWWVDTGVTRHVYGERNIFSTYVPVNGRNLIMRNFATSRVVEIGKVVLKMTSEKELVLTDVLHVPDIRKNLVSGSMLSKNGFKLVFESDKFVLMKNGMYVGKEYMTNVPFKMNVMTVKLDFNNNKASTSVYLIESFTLWHDSVCGSQDD